MSDRKKRRAKHSGGNSPASPGEARREAARKLAERAMGEEDLERRASLARKALKIDDENADGWGVLAELEEDEAEAVRLFEEAHGRGLSALGEVARRVIAEEQEEEPATHVSLIWEDEAGPTYVRARAGLATRLALLEGREEEAISHMMGVLRLDPLDRMDLSHSALSLLLGRGDEESDEQARRIMDSHPCDCVHHCFLGTLLCFREAGGEAVKTKRSVIEAIGSGPLVAPYLFGKLELPENLPSAEATAQAARLGEKQRALLLSASVASDLLPAWKKTPGAQRWLEGVYATMISRYEQALEDPAKLVQLADSGEEGLAGMLGVSLAWEEAEACFVYWREREDEDVATSKFKDALMELIEHRAREAGLTLAKGTAPYPTGVSPCAELVGEPEGVSPLSYLRATGEAGKVAELANGLLDLGFSEFTLATEDPGALEKLEEITGGRPSGVLVFEGPAKPPEAGRN